MEQRWRLYFDLTGSFVFKNPFRKSTSTTILKVDWVIIKLKHFAVQLFWFWLRHGFENLMTPDSFFKGGHLKRVPTLFKAGVSQALLQGAWLAVTAGARRDFRAAIMEEADPCLFQVAKVRHVTAVCSAQALLETVIEAGKKLTWQTCSSTMLGLFTYLLRCCLECLL